MFGPLILVPGRLFFFKALKVLTGSLMWNKLPWKRLKSVTGDHSFLTVSGQFPPPRQLPPGQLPQAYSPRTIAPQDNSPRRQLPPGQSPPDNCPLPISPRTIPPPAKVIVPPGEFPHLTQNFFCFCFGMIDMLNCCK